jgi:DNA repair exonuclease SbcCD nuclease subunit
MAKRVARPAVQGIKGDTPLRGGVSDRVSERGDVVLKVLHTADWHLGRRFPSFPEEAQKKLSRARMEVIARVFDVARRNSVGAVLCAGDLFDDPTPSEDFWEGLAKTLRDHPGPHVPTFLVPGNHDPTPSDGAHSPVSWATAQLGARCRSR